MTTPLHRAARFNDTENIIKRCQMAIEDASIEKVINAENEKGHTPLYFAIIYEKHAATKLLISYGANVNSIIDGESLLYTAIYFKNYSIILALIEGGADVNYIDSNYTTLLHCAIHINDVDVVQLLLNNGANPLSVINKTPNIETITNNEEILKVLSEALKERDIPDIKGAL